MTFITTEIVPKTNGAVVIVGSIGKTYIGLIELDDDGNMLFLDRDLVCLYRPLKFMEVIGPGNTQGSIECRVGMDPIWYSLGLIDKLVVKFDHIYSFEDDDAKDQKLVSSYFEAIKQYMAKDSGIIAPTQNDIIKLGTSGS